MRWRLQDDLAVVTDKNFDAAVRGDVAVVYFWSRRCAACRDAGAALRRVAAARTRPGFGFASCDIRVARATVRRLDVELVPCIVAFDRAGRELTRLVGTVTDGDVQSLALFAEVGR